jgi:hypothetical protein
MRTRRPHGSFVVPNAACLSLIFAVASLGPAFASASAGAQPMARAAAGSARNASALTGPLAVGATVRDGAGVTLGRITRLTTGANGQTVVMLRKGVDSFQVPANVLQISGNGVISSLSRQDIKALGEPATR